MSDEKYVIFEYGPMEEWHKHLFPVPEEVRKQTGVEKVPGKRFAKNDLNLQFMDFSINKLAAGMELPFVHKHRQQEELYFFLKGSGQILIEKDLLNVSAGTAVKINPDYFRTLRNTSLSEPLYYLCFRAQGDKISEVAEDVAKVEMFDWFDVTE